MMVPLIWQFDVLCKACYQQRTVRIPMYTAFHIVCVMHVCSLQHYSKYEWCYHRISNFFKNSSKGKCFLNINKIPS